MFLETVHRARTFNNRVRGEPIEKLGYLSRMDESGEVRWFAYGSWTRNARNAIPVSRSRYEETLLTEARPGEFNYQWSQINV